MASARVCEFCRTKFRSAKSKPICPTCGKRQQVATAPVAATNADGSMVGLKTSTVTNGTSAARPSMSDWLIGIVGIGGVLLSLVGAFVGVLVLFFVGIGMLVGAFIVQRLLRYKAGAPNRVDRRS